jgi:hypothetical protein
MNNSDDKKITELYKQIPRENPSEILDARIKLEARRQLKRGTTIRSYQWMSVAALVVLSVGVVLRVLDEAPVEQSVEENIEMLDKAVILKEEQKSFIRHDSDSMVVPGKMKKAIEPTVGNMASSAVKVQTPAAAAVPAATTTFSAAMKADMEREIVADQMAKQEVFYHPENMCGINELSGIDDRTTWEKAVEKLRSEKKFGQAECLQKLMKLRLLEQ